MEKGLVIVDGEEFFGLVWDFIRTFLGSWEVCSGQVGVGGEDIFFEVVFILGIFGFFVFSIQRFQSSLKIYLLFRVWSQVL